MTLPTPPPPTLWLLIGIHISSVHPVYSGGDDCSTSVPLEKPLLSLLPAGDYYRLVPYILLLTTSPETQKLLGGLETRGKNIGILLHSGEDGVSLLRNVLRLQFRTRLGLDSSHVTELEQKEQSFCEGFILTRTF